MTNSIRLIHNIPRSGGTIISKCIAAQKNVILLSEIHESGEKARIAMSAKPELADPINQSIISYDLFSDLEKKEHLNKNYNLEKKINIILEKAEKINKKLVIRDWSFLDFFGKPFIEPIFKNSLLEFFQKKFNIVNFFIIRHPLETWISCGTHVPYIRKNYNFLTFIECYQRYFNYFKNYTVFKYEDFYENPDFSLKKMCNVLDIDFDENFRLKLEKIQISGDGKANMSNDIKKNIDKRDLIIPEKDMKVILNNKKYLNLLENLKEFYQ